MQNRNTSRTSFLKWLKMRLKEGRYPGINPLDLQKIVVKPDRKLIFSPADQPRATWIGHATVLIQYGQINILTDPHFTAWPAPVDFFIPTRHTRPALSYEELVDIDFIVISHNHYDHLDHRTVKLFGNSVTWFVPWGLKRWFKKQGIDSCNIVESEWWQSHTYNKDVTVTFTPAVHWSKRTPWDTNKSLWGSWSIRIMDFTCWFGGDTAYDSMLFKEIGQRTGPYDLALIPIGAYGPRYFMLSQHVDPAQAILIHRDIISKLSIPIHWGTFQLTHEPFFEPPRLLKTILKSEKYEKTQFFPIRIGETVTIQPGGGDSSF
ncbi:MBL fold metallo-hydrolase [Desulfomarina profundi]|uniref:MBL fold metallo-hydrolase n=1 Tax=Desulfomarina profundi TaxID=2772557 RepID=A0A8D5FGT6_9BACT|nr:MBL fold metallo-hydrolase [Desulfomarina profundi]BCL60355.1 MBL fold metallo-hydrolase [Desulfomarina profundi]